MRLPSRTGAAYYQREEIVRAIELARREGDVHRVVPILLDGQAHEVDVPYGLRLRQGISVAWVAAFRILSDPNRAARFAATPEERARLGQAPRDYCSDDQVSWYYSCDERSQGRDVPVSDVLGIDWRCFSGDGITRRQRGLSGGIPSRVFFVRNLPPAGITYRVQDLGVPDDDLVLD